jgi:tetratricopeptide (TPR) repeat protein
VWKFITEQQLKEASVDKEEMWRLKAELLENIVWSDELRSVINEDLKYFGQKQSKPYILKSRALMSCDKYREAVAVLEDGLLFHPNDTELLLLLVECLLRLDIRTTEVHRILLQLRSQNPTDLTLLQKQIDTLQKISTQQNNVDELLISLCNEHLHLQPTASLYALRGKIFLKRNQIPQALNDFMVGLKLVPESMVHILVIVIH